jgi:hypothetical protein
MSKNDVRFCGNCKHGPSADNCERMDCFDNPCNPHARWEEVESRLAPRPEPPADIQALARAVVHAGILSTDAGVSYPGAALIEEYIAAHAPRPETGGDALVSDIIDWAIESSMEAVPGSENDVERFGARQREALTRNITRLSALLASQGQGDSIRCPSCRCVVDEHGNGHHSVADCVFMRLARPLPLLAGLGDAETCPSCHGIGAVLRTDENYHVGDTCPRCSGRGHIKTHPQPSPGLREAVDDGYASKEWYRDELKHVHHLLDDANAIVAQMREQITGYVVQMQRANETIAAVAHQRNEVFDALEALLIYADNYSESMRKIGKGAEELGPDAAYPSVGWKARSTLARSTLAQSVVSHDSPDASHKSDSVSPMSHKAQSSTPEAPVSNQTIIDRAVEYAMSRNWLSDSNDGEAMAFRAALAQSGREGE